MAAIRVLLLFLLIGFSTGQILRLQLNQNIAVTFLDCSVLLLLLYWLGKKIQKKSLKQFINHSLVKPLCIFISICLLSLVLNPLGLAFDELMKSSLYIVRWGMYVGMYFVIQDVDKKEKTFLKKGMIGITAFIVGTGFVQYFFYSNLINLYYLGWDDHMYRLFSVFLDPNFAGVIMSLMFFFIFGIFFNESSRNSKVFFGILALSLFVAIFLTHSRTALLTLVSGSCALLLFLRQKRWIFYIGISLFLLFFITMPFFHIENVNPFRTASSTARVESLTKAIRIFESHPIFGVGFNTYSYAQRKYGFSTEKTIPSHSEAGTDNSWVFVLATTGIVGFLSYSYLWYVILKKIITNAYQEHYQKPVLLATCAGLFVSSFFLNTLFYTAILAWVWMLIGTMESK